MEEFAKVEKLVEMTGASYEDARNALRACDGDMVDSMVYLEKLGKVTKYNTNTDPRFAPISEAEIAAAEASISALLIAGVFYYVFNALVAFIMERFEKRLDYYDT